MLEIRVWKLFRIESDGSTITHNIIMRLAAVVMELGRMYVSVKC